MAKAKQTEAKANIDTEIWLIIRGDELGKKAEILYEFALKQGYRTAIKEAQRVAGVEQNGVMSDESLAAINALKDAEFINAYEQEIKAYE